MIFVMGALLGFVFGVVLFTQSGNPRADQLEAELQRTKEAFESRGETIDEMCEEHQEAQNRYAESLVKCGEQIEDLSDQVEKLNAREADSLEALKRFNNRMADYCRDREEWQQTLLFKNSVIEKVRIELDTTAKHNGDLQTRIAELEKQRCLETAEWLEQVATLEEQLATYRRPPEQQEHEPFPTRFHDWCANKDCSLCNARFQNERGPVKKPQREVED